MLTINFTTWFFIIYFCVSKLLKLNFIYTNFVFFNCYSSLPRLSISPWPSVLSTVAEYPVNHGWVAEAELRGHRNVYAGDSGAALVSKIKNFYDSPPWSSSFGSSRSLFWSSMVSSLVPSRWSSRSILLSLSSQSSGLKLYVCVWNLLYGLII